MSKEQIKEEENRAIESINKTSSQKAAKRRRLNEEAEDVEELKQHLEIMPDEDDEVYTEATLLDRKERFSTSKPNNYSDDYLLITLKAMFKRPDGQDLVWKSQRSVHGQAKVKSWKLLESCEFMKMNTASSSCSGTLPGITITNPKEDMKGITTRKGTAYPGPTIPTSFSSSVVERETEATKDTMHPANNGSTENVQPLVIPTESPILTSEPVISPIIEHVASLVSAPRPNLRPSIPYPSRLQDQKLCDKANDQ
nr:reverse transcriptase domain-containing protein [Tanacetum cinerariifolium]